MKLDIGLSYKCASDLTISSGDWSSHVIVVAKVRTLKSGSERFDRRCMSTNVKRDLEFGSTMLHYHCMSELGRMQRCTDTRRYVGGQEFGPIRARRKLRKTAEWLSRDAREIGFSPRRNRSPKEKKKNARTWQHKHDRVIRRVIEGDEIVRGHKPRTRAKNACDMTPRELSPRLIIP